MLKPIQEVYPQEEEGYFPSMYDYQPLLESFGYPILLQVNDDDYQGDSRLIFQDGELYGLLIFGWGSCSGCDALQMCNTYEEVDTLRTQLYTAIQWFDSSKAMLGYLTTHDWQGDYSWSQDFVEQAKTLMEERVKDARRDHDTRI